MSIHGRIARRWYMNPDEEGVATVGSRVGQIPPSRYPRHAMMIAYQAKKVLPMLAFLLLFSWNFVAWGTTYTVSTSGNNSSCSDIRTIHFGIANCARNPGDILDIREGQYPEQLHYFDTGLNWPSGTDFGSGAITIRGHAGETVVINPTATKTPFDVVYGQNVQYLIFDNLTFDGANLTAGQMWKFDNSHHLRVTNCLFKNGNLYNAVQAAGPFNEYLNNEVFGMGGYPFYVSGSDNLFADNYLHDNGGYGIHLYQSHLDCPTLNCVNRNVVRANLFVRNGCTVAPGDSSGVTAAQIVLGQGSGNTAYNNVFRDSCKAGIQFYAQSVGAQVFFNTIVGSAQECFAIDPNAGSGNRFQNNICYNNRGGDTGSMPGGQIVDHNWLSSNGNPQFVNLAGGDLHLTAGSPNAVRNGGIAGTGITVDIENRPRDATPSLGAYEFSGGLLPPILPIPPILP